MSRALCLAVFCIVVLLASSAQAQLSPGNSCSGTGQVSLSNINPAYLLACNGSTWVLGESISSTGQIGIGTAAPADNLHIYQNAAAGTGLRIENPNTSAAPAIFFYDGTHSSYFGVDGTAVASIRAGKGYIYNDFNGITLDAVGGSGIITFVTGADNAANERMRIDASGNVGIGTATPAYPIQLVSSATFGQVAIQGTDVTGFTGLDLAGTGRSFWLGVGNGSNAFGVNNKFFIYDGISSAYRLIMDSNGNVGIGTTSPGTSLDVNGGVTTEPTSVTLTANNTVLSTANSSYFRVTSNNTTAANRIFCMGSGTAGQLVIIEWTSSTNKGEIVDNGTCSSASGAVAANLSATWAPAAADATIELIYNGTKWLQLSVSVN